MDFQGITDPDRFTRVGYLRRSTDAYREILNRSAHDGDPILSKFRARGQVAVRNLIVPRKDFNELYFEEPPENNDSIGCYPYDESERRLFLTNELITPSNRQTALGGVALLKYGFEMLDLRAISATFSSYDDFPAELTADTIVAVHTGSIFVPIPNSDAVASVRFRPSMLININRPDGSRSHSLSPAELHRGIAYIIQTLRKPVSRLRTRGDYEDEILANRLEATLRTADILDEMRRQDYEPLPNEKQISNSTHTYIIDVNEKFNELRAKGLTFSQIVKVMRLEGILSELADNISDEEREEPLISNEQLF